MFKKGKIHRTEGTEVLIILEGRGKLKKNKKLNKHKKKINNIQLLIQYLRVNVMTTK